jgi:hypothetical protein
VRVRIPLAALILALGPGCSGPGAAGAGDPPQDRCAAETSRIRGLYVAEASPAEGADPAVEADILAANVEMVLDDCRADPERAIPCIRRAGSVAALERDCVIPVDADGQIEERRFGGSSPKADR